MSDYYQGNWQHIQDELLYIGKILESEILKFQANRPEDENRLFPSIHISDSEIGAILDRTKSGNNENSSTQQQDEIRKLEMAIAAKVEKCGQNGITLNLIRLAELFNLSALELEVLMLCLALETDRNYEKIFAYLQDRSDLVYPTIDFILKIFCSSFEERMYARKIFAPDSPLVANRLIGFVPEKDYNQPLSTCQVILDKRIAGYLLEDYALDQNLILFTELFTGSREAVNTDLPEQTRNSIAAYFNSRPAKEFPGQRKLIFIMPGIDESNKKATAGMICGYLDLPLLIVNMEAFKQDDEFCKQADLVFRESRLLDAALYFINSSLFFGNSEVENFAQDYFLKKLNSSQALVFFSSAIALSFQDKLASRVVIELPFSFLEYRERIRSWQEKLAQGSYQYEPIDIEALASRFRLAGNQITAALNAAYSKAFWRSPDAVSISGDDLYEACRLQSNRKLGSLARKITSRDTWKDIVLPANQLAQLKEIVNYEKYKYRVYDDWGFNKKLSLGKGLNVIFFGSSGTGKTMAAGIISNALGLDLYKIDLSTVVSKYIGETEKNLSRIFEEAETSNAILFFDEADTLFGKRTEVKDAHDRYANIEVGYLLQRMDEYKGVVILATNMHSNMDDAFVRRMHFSVEFPFPDEEQRLLIWRNIFPGETPVAGGIDYTFLSKNMKITGGNIKNIALAAAFYAAGDGREVTMEHIIHASRREFEKLGKLCIKADFGKYYDLVAGKS